ncbi:MAG: response regulator [Ruminococcus sp.]|nr:response regulator [Ruminococcus sp.]
MKRDTEKKDLFQTSHFVILISYTVFSALLIFESLLLGWEKWAVLMIILGVTVSWIMHIQHRFSYNSRIWMYYSLMMFTFFFYGSHTTSTFDLAAVMSAIVVLCTMTGIKGLITMCQITYYLTFGYGIVGIVHDGGKFDLLAVTRIILHIVMMHMVCLFSRTVIDKWNEVLGRSHEEIGQLTEVTERLNDFLANVSHELRTPINAVIGLSGICMDKEDDKEVLTDLCAVHDAGKRVADQICDILDYSEIVSGKLARNDEDYMLSSVLSDLVNEIRPHKSKELELVIDVDPAIPSILNGDVSKLKKILRHLIMNGLKYTYEGGVYVRISTEKKTYGVNLRIEVADTGIGMTEYQMERLFDMFYQADSSRTRNVSGLGLGLAIVSGFVSVLGGFLTLNSKQGEGTTVRVSVPQRVVDNTSCMSVDQREKLCLGAFLHFEKFPHPIVREYYNNMVRNIVKGFGVQMHRVENIENLKKLVENLKLTHLFIGEKEYIKDVALMERYAKDMLVVVVADGDFILPEGSHARIMEKPFYCFPVASVLNMDVNSREEIEKRMFCHGVKALVVDDEPMNLSVAKSIFKRYGMEVTTASSGQEAVMLCRSRKFDVVFMDHMMPEMDGVEAMKRIRSDVSRNKEELPIVALTANAVSTAKEMFLAEGFDGFVSKPVELAEFERVLIKVLPKSYITYESIEERSDINEQTGHKNVPAEKTAEENDVYSRLRQCGVDIDAGLGYCQGDEEFYRTLLIQFASGTAEKKNNLEKYLSSDDIKNYEIIIHSLKSSSKMIGDMSLSEKARQLEMAAKEGRREYIRANHYQAMEEYLRLTEAISSSLGKDNGEVLEFLPDSDIIEFEPEGEKR